MHHARGEVWLLVGGYIGRIPQLQKRQSADFFESFMHRTYGGISACRQLLAVKFLVTLKAIVSAKILSRSPRGSGAFRRLKSYNLVGK